MKNQNIYKARNQSQFWKPKAGLVSEQNLKTKTEGITMAKMPNATVVVKNNETGETSTCQATQTPRKVEPGVYLYLKINQKGMEWLQANKIDLRNTKDLEDYWCDMTGMPKEGIGSLGNWKTDAERAKWTVTINGKPYLGQPIKIVKKATQKVAPVPIATDTTTPRETGDEKYINMIVEGLSGGTKEETIRKVANEKFGAEKAEKLISEAKEILAKQVEKARGPSEFSFS